jgi:hypothetical protein
MLIKIRSEDSPENWLEARLGASSILQFFYLGTMDGLVSEGLNEFYYHQID